jgi:RimJ/RimL family protein N-acetyltransferase
MAALSEHRVAELGCCVVPAARGRGVATEALRLLADWALGTLGLGRVQVFVAPENAPALRLSESAGFRREGVAPLVLGERSPQAELRRSAQATMRYT